MLRRGHAGFHFNNRNGAAERAMPPASERTWTRLSLGLARRLASARVGSLLLIGVFGFTLAVAFFPYSQAVGLVRSVGDALALESLSNASEIGFQERFESPAFVALLFVLGVSLCLSLGFRVRSEMLRRRTERAARRCNEVRNLPDGPQGATLASVAKEVKARGYRTYLVREARAWHLHGAKGGNGVLGSVLFHIAILLVLVAVALSVSASFRASVKLTEGQSFDSRKHSYGKERLGPWYASPGQPLTFRLVRVDPQYEVGGAVTVASIVEPTLEGEASRFLGPAPVFISHGLEHAGVTIHQGRESGFAPYVVVEDPAGKRLLEGFTQLANVADAGRVSHVDYVYVKDRELSVELELLPDAVYRDGRYVSRSNMPKRPVLRAVVREFGETRFEEFVPMTRDLTAGGYTVYFGDLRRWSQLDVVDVPGVALLMAATLLGSIGLALRLLQVRRRIVVTLADDDTAAGLRLEGSSEKFQRHFQEELSELQTALAARLTVGHAG